MKALGPSNEPGIYVIHNLRNGKQYIGSATRFKQRWYLHKLNLRRGEHHSEILQRAWNKYGEDAFEFRILEIVEDKSTLLAREQFYFDTRKPQYNICLIAGSRLGLQNKEIHKARIRAALNTPESQAKLIARFTGKKQSPEHCAARSRGMRGNTNGAGNVVTPEQRAAMNAGRAKQMAADKAAGVYRGPRPTEEQRKAVAERMRAVHAAKSPEQRAAEAAARGMARAAKGYTDEQRATIAEQSRQRAANMTPEERAVHSAKLSAGKTGIPRTPEALASMRAKRAATRAAKGLRVPYTEEERKARAKVSIAAHKARKKAARTLPAPLTAK